MERSIDLIKFLLTFRSDCKYVLYREVSEKTYEAQFSHNHNAPRSQHPNRNVFSSRLNKSSQVYLSLKLMSACRSSVGRLFHSFGQLRNTCLRSCCMFVSQRTSLMWQNAADDDLRRRLTDSRRPDRLEPCRTVKGGPSL